MDRKFCDCCDEQVETAVLTIGRSASLPGVNVHITINAHGDQTKNPPDLCKKCFLRAVCEVINYPWPPPEKKKAPEGIF